jgi:hypothetical protein
MSCVELLNSYALFCDDQLYKYTFLLIFVFTGFHRREADAISEELCQVVQQLHQVSPIRTIKQ